VDPDRATDKEDGAAVWESSIQVPAPLWKAQDTSSTGKTDNFIAFTGQTNNFIALPVFDPDQSELLPFAATRSRIIPIG
jgi:hypothetical protein